MTYSWTTSWDTTFTVTHARHLATKVTADLKRMQRYYGRPGDAAISDYETELTELLKGGFVEVVTYGFQRAGHWIEPTVRYTARELLSWASDDDPGKVPARADVSGAHFGSYLVYSAAWQRLGAQEREQVERRLPFRRSIASEPGIDGYLCQDRTYSAGGRALDRYIVRTENGAPRATAAVRRRRIASRCTRPGAA
jgi:hypothetical protein